MIEIINAIWEQFRAISLIEGFGVITGALCVYLAAKENILNWPISILSVVTYIYIFYNSKLYGDTILQFYFLFTAVYGWYYWTFGVKSSTLKSARPVTRLSQKHWFVILFLLVSLSFLAGYLLDRFTDTDVPFIDAFCTITSFIAQYLMTRKKLENWLIWIFIDIIYIPLYIHKELFATAALCFIFTIIAIKGYIDWKRSYLKTVQND